MSKGEKINFYFNKMEPEKKLSGAFVGLVVIIIILIVGAVYLWKSEKKSNPNTPNGNPAESIVDQDATALNALESEAKSIDIEAGVDANAVN